MSVEQAARGLLVDAIAAHWYGSDFPPAKATEGLRRYLTAVHARYGRPVGSPSTR